MCNYIYIYICIQVALLASLALAAAPLFAYMSSLGVLSSIANRRPMGFLSIPRYPIYPDILGTS